VSGVRKQMTEKRNSLPFVFCHLFSVLDSAAFDKLRPRACRGELVAGCPLYLLTPETIDIVLFKELN